MTTLLIISSILIWLNIGFWSMVIYKTRVDKEDVKGEDMPALFIFSLPGLLVPIVIGLVLLGRLFRKDKILFKAKK